MGFLPLIINEPIREQLRALAARAAADPTPLEAILALQRGELQPAAFSAGKTIDIPAGFHVVFTHEHQPGGILRHLSVSIDIPNRVPHPEAVRMIMEEIGFVLPLEECLAWEEPCGPTQHAINVVEPVDGDWTPHRKADATSG